MTIHIAKVDGLSKTSSKIGPLKDVCPFTAMGVFNRGITDANRTTIATELALLGVSEADSFENTGSQQSAVMVFRFR